MNQDDMAAFIRSAQSKIEETRAKDPLDDALNNKLAVDFAGDMRGLCARLEGVGFFSKEVKLSLLVMVVSGLLFQESDSIDEALSLLPRVRKALEDSDRMIVGGVDAKKSGAGEYHAGGEGGDGSHSGAG